MLNFCLQYLFLLGIYLWKFHESGALFSFPIAVCPVHRTLPASDRQAFNEYQFTGLPQQGFRVRRLYAVSVLGLGMVSVLSRLTVGHSHVNKNAFLKE